MSTRRTFLAGGLGLTLAGAAGAVLWHRRPQDPLPAVAGTPLATIPEAPRVLALGTSLTARYDWPDTVRAGLERCLQRPVTMTVEAAPGETVAWGQGRHDQILAAAPDLVLLEFTVNDADARDGLSLQDSRALHARLLADLHAARPDCRVLLLGMNPVHGLRGLLRWRHRAYLQTYVALAAADSRIGFLDLAPAWQDWLATRDRSEVLPDGLHPRPDAARQVLTAPVTAAAARLLGGGCA